MIFVFIHIAKTAGSSVNHFFQQQFGEAGCLVHQESNPALRQTKVPPELLEGVHFVSGHIPYHTLTARLSAYHLHTLTVLRDPRAHVVSHLAWIRYLKDSGQEQRLAVHAPFIQQLANKLADLDLSSAEALVDLVESLSLEELRLLDNPQVRHLTHYPHTPAGMQTRDVSSALETLRETDTFGFIEDPQGLFEAMAEAVGARKEAIAVPHENALGNRYGLDPGDEAQMQALMPLIQHDMTLYAEAYTLYQDRLAGNASALYRRRHTRGHMGAPNAKGRLPGWAFDVQSDVAAKLDVYVNRRLVATVDAERHRRDLNEKFSRDCAFLLDLKTLQTQPGDQLAIFFHGTGIELNGSPRQMPDHTTQEPVEKPSA